MKELKQFVQQINASISMISDTIFIISFLLLLGGLIFSFFL